jgi:3-methylfumaryl-CoA hydratase
MPIEPLEITSLLHEWPVRALEAALDLPVAEDSDELPPLWHWLYFLRAARRSELGADGHPAVAGQDPARPKRRMFAAARAEFFRPLRLGEPARMVESHIRSRDTQGASGPLHIVTLGYEYFQQGDLCIREERDIVYLDAADAPRVAASGVRKSAGTPAETVQGEAAPEEAAPNPAWASDITPDAILLFRFSALTFNAHRIHYDRRYAIDIEGHRERVVHGPLVAILLAEMLRRHWGRPVRRFEFRARRPLFVDETIRLRAEPSEAYVTLRALDPSGATAMEATAA